MVYLLIVFLFALIVIDFVKNKKLHTPGIIFNGIFFVTLFLYVFYLSHIQQQLSSKTIFVLFLSVLSFNLPVFVSYFIKRKKHSTFMFYNTSMISMSPKAEFKMYYFIVILFICEILYCGGCPATWKLTGDVRTYFDFGIPKLHIIFWFLVTVMGIRTLFRKNDFTKFTYLAISVLIISRALMVILILGGIFYKLCSIKKINGKVIFILIIVGVLTLGAFSVIGNFRTGESVFVGLVRFKEQYEWMPTTFKWLYSYICFSISNLNNLLNNFPAYVTEGTAVLNSVMPNFIKNRIGFELLPAPYFLVDPIFNVSTFIPNLYFDFGIYGIVIYSFGMGVFLSWLYHMSKFDEALKILYSISLCNLSFILFSDMFLSLTYVLEVIVFTYYCIFRDRKYSKILKGDMFYERNYFSRGKWN